MLFGHAGPFDCVRRTAIVVGAACLWVLALGLALPQTSEAAPEGRQCDAEPTEMIIGYGDLILCAIDAPGDQDVFQFSGGNGEVVRIQIAGSDAGRRACFELFDLAASSVDGVVCANGAADFELGQSGTYTVRVSEAGDRPVSYALLVERISPTSPAAAPLGLDQGIEDEINEAADVDVFSFAGDAGDTVRIGLSGGIDPSRGPCFELFDPAAMPVGDIMCADATEDYQLEQTGIYVILVTERGNDQPVSYALSRSCISGECADGLDDAPVSGCLVVQGVPQADRAVELTLQDGTQRTTRTDIRGCFRFDDIDEDQRFDVALDGDEVPSPAPLPTAQLSADPSTIAAGGSSTLSWSSSNATGCAGTNFSTGGRTAGSTSVSPTATTTYRLDCTGPAGSASAAATVTVAPRPTAQLSADPGTITAGQSSTLRWSSANATSCTGAGFSTGGRTAGSASVSPTANTTYRIDCRGPGGAANASATVNVRPQPPTARLSANPGTITAGESSTLRWSSTNATSCAGANFPTGGRTAGSTAVSPTATTTYRIDCTGPGGSANASATVNVPPPPRPTARLSANPSTIVAGGPPARLDWSSTNATSCAGTNFSTGGRTSGTASVAPTATTTYRIDCRGPGGSASASATVNVPPPPTAQISANPSSIRVGRSSALSWSSTNATTCGGFNFSTGGQTSGTTSVSPTVTTTYQISCAGPGGEAGASATVTVTFPPLPPTARLTATPDEIGLGGSSTLTWSSTNATRCDGTNFSTGGQTSGSATVTPPTTGTFRYEIRCSGPGGLASAFATVGVGPF